MCFQTGELQNSVFGYQCYVFLYINDVLKTVNGKFKPLLLADDYYTVLTSSNVKDLKNDIDVEFVFLNECFKANGFCLNIN